jgi:hypothetical protein
VSVAVGAVALFPAYIKAQSALNTVSSVVASMMKENTESGLAPAEKELSADKALLALLTAGTGAPRLSDVIQAVSSLRSDVVIDSIGLSRSQAGIVVTLSGMAPTRDGLIMFKSRLEPLLAKGTTINEPISDELKINNVPFSLQFVESLP